MPLDIERLRRETPGCERVVHLNNAGAALQPQPVVDAVLGHLRLEAQIGGYEAENRAHSAIERTYCSIARLINCAPEEIAMIENATRAWDMAFYSYAGLLRPDDRILTSVSEYASNYISYLQVTRTRGVTVEAVPNDEHGALSVPALESMIDDRVKLIAVTHVPTNGGLVNPVAEIGRVARRAGIPYLLDACQSVGQLPVDVAAIGCDFLSATGRKYLRGPRGTGFLYMRKAWIDRLEPVFLDLHAATWTSAGHYELRPDARRFENWESYVAGRVGLGAAVDYAMGVGVAAMAQRICDLARSARRSLAMVPGVQVRDLGDPATRCGIVSFTCEGREPKEVHAALRDRSINVSVSGASSTYLDMTQRGLSSVIRASVHCYNTESEIEGLCEALSRNHAQSRSA